MSLQAAIGQIDQILQLQQQILDPASATSATSTAGDATAQTGGASLGAGGTSSGASFAQMLAGAQSSGSLVDPSATLDADALGGSSEASALASPVASAGVSPLTGATATGAAAQDGGASPLTGAGLTDPISSGVTDPVLATLPTSASAGTPPAVQAMVSKADSLLGKPYVWGGGHDDFGPQPGYDCSGFVSAVLHAGGLLSAPQDTQTLPSQPGIESGPGRYVTIYDRTDAGLGEDHVIIDLNGQFYESGGGHGPWGGGGGVEKIGTPSAAYLASFNDVLHPEGM